MGHLRILLAACMDIVEPAGQRGTPAAAPNTTPDLAVFTTRELEFMRLVRHPDCWPYPYIAVCMKLKLPTLHYLRRSLFKKLGVKGRTAFALKVRDWVLD